MSIIKNKNFMLFAIFVIISIILSFYPPLLFWIDFIYDDACFYIKTAYNYSQGFGSTFDGINPTNGYQPLWFILLAAVYYIISLFTGNLTPDSLIRITVFIHFMLFYFTFYFSYKAFRIIFPKHSIFSSVLLSVSLCIIPILIRNMGLETSITTFILSIYFWIKSREIFLKENHLAYKTSLLIFLFLSRIDFLITLIPVLILYECFDRDLRKYFRNLLKMGTPIFIAASAYFLYNYLNYGHFLTVSSYIKSNFNNIYLFTQPEYLVNFFRNWPIISFNVLMLLAVSTVFLIRMHSDKDSETGKIETFLFWMLVGFNLFIFQNILLNVFILCEWYFAGPVYILVISVVIILKKSELIKNTIAGGLIIISVYYTYQTRIVYQKYETFYNYALELKEIVPAEDEILLVDYSGMIGLISERKVVNGDGLINSFEYYDYVKRNAVPEYLKKYHIDYYSTYRAVIDSSANTITSQEVLGEMELTFPLDKIVYRRPQIFSSYYNPRECEWFLISLK